MSRLKSMFDEYISNVREARERIKPMIAAGLSDDELILAIERNADKLFRIKTRNTTILDDCIFQVIDEPELITKEQADELFEVASELYVPGHNIDAPIAFSLHKALLSYARFINDVDIIIRELYFCGAIMFEMNKVPNSLGIKLFNSKIRDYFAEAAANYDDIDSFESETTRSYIIRSKGNVILALQNTYAPDKNALYAINADEIRKTADYRQEMADFLSDPVVRSKAPSLPWDAMLRQTHLNQTTLVGTFRAMQLPELKELAYNSAKYLYDEALLEDANELSMHPRILYAYYVMLFETARISVYDFLDMAIEVMRSADPSDYSASGQFKNFHMVAYCTYYWVHYTNSDPRYLDVLTQFSTRSREYVMKLPAGEHFLEATSMLRNSMAYTYSADLDDLEHFLLWHLVAFHKPTYVHSLMVAELSRTLIYALIDNAPEKLIGVLDTTSTDSVRENKEALGSLAYRAGLYHDIGKIMLIDVVSMYGRNLTWEEFQLIRCHPYAGYLTLCGLGKTKDVAAGALGHHVWYDGRGGYPDIYATIKCDITPIVNILSVADSIDAATDDIGRCYSYVKTYDALRKELFDYSGSRYAAYVIDLLRDAEVDEAVRSILRKKRREIYVDVYREK